MRQLFQRGPARVVVATLLGVLLVAIQVSPAFPTSIATAAITSLDQASRQASGATLSPASLSFGSVRVNTVAQGVITATNTSGVTWISATPTFSGPAASDFSGSSCGPVGPGQTCQIALGFKPQGLGTRSAAVSLTTTPAVTSDSTSLAGTAAPTFLVNTVDDVDNGACTSAHCSLREAINASNATAGRDAIGFGIPGTGPFTIAPTTALPGLRDAVIIDGATQGTGATNAIIIEGTRLDARLAIDGLTLSGSGSSISGLTIQNFGGTGIVAGTDATNISGNKLLNNGTLGLYVGASGVDVAFNEMRNNGSGIGMDASNATLRSNTVTGNRGNGILMSGSGNSFTSNTFDGNGSAGVLLGFPGLTTRNNVFNGNIVRNNAAEGFLLRGPTGFPTEITDGNTINGGSITNNAREGILLFLGANKDIQPPAITGIQGSSTRLVVSGTSLPNAKVQIYADPSDEGAQFLATTTADGTGAWQNSTWGEGTDLAALVTALRTGALVIRATQTDGPGNTSQFSLTRALIATLVGVAKCRSTDGETTTTTLLPFATVQLLSGSVVVATTRAASDGSYSFSALAPLSTYDVRYTRIGEGFTQSCGVSVTTDANGGGTVPDPPALLNRKNHTWFRPFPLATGAAVSDVLTRFRQKTWYSLQVGPQQIVTVRLTNLPKDYNLTAYRDLRQVLAEIKAQSGTLGGIKTLNASTHDIAIDEISIDEIGIDEIGIDEIGIDEIGIDEIGIDEIGIDEIGIDEIGIDEIGIADVANSHLYAAVERRGLRGLSARRGTADEVIRIRTRNYSGLLYFRVGGRGGDFDAGNLFRIAATAVSADSSCATAALNPRAPLNSVAPGGKKTLIFTNTARLGLSGTAASDLITMLNTKVASRSEVNGVVVDLNDDANLRLNYADWEGAARACVHQARAVADSIHQVVDQARVSNPIEYLAIVGGNLVVPYGLLRDGSELLRENRYSESLDGASAGEASLAQAYVPTDDFYAASRPILRLGRELYVPEIGVGRLVETVQDITAYINAYTGVMANPSSAIATGYDFLIKLTNATANDLRSSGVSVDTSLVSNTWSADDLRKALLQGTARYGYIGLQAHYSAGRLVPANNSARLLSTEIANVTDGRFANSHVVSVGCHSGYNIQDPEATALTQPVAFPEAFLRQGATVYGQTGYAYGDTVLVKNSEALLAKYTHELRFRQDAAFNPYPNGVPVGKALVNAKRAYLDELLVLRGIDEKVLAEATIYGLPTFAVSLPQTIDRPRPVPITTTPSPRNTAGLSTADVTPSYTLNRNPAGATASTPSFFDAGAGDLSFTQTIPVRPILPRTVVDVRGQTTAGTPTLARGAVFLSGTYDELAFTPRLATPVTQDSVPGPTTYLNTAFTPVRPIRLNQFAGETLVFTPMQYLANPAGTNGTARAYRSITSRVYYSTRTGDAAAADAPAIRDVALSQTADQRVHVDVTVSALNDPGVEDVWVTFTNGDVVFPQWQSTQMFGAPPTTNGTFGFMQHFTADIDPALGGTVPRDPLSVRLFIQAVSGVGAVSLATNDGAYYRIIPDTTSAQQPKITTKLVLTTPAQASYRSQISVTATLTDANAPASQPRPLGGRGILFRLPGSGAIALTNSSGTATATLNVLAPPGDHAITASYLGEADALPTGVSASIKVTSASTSFAPTAPATVEYSDSVFVVSLVLTSSGLPLIDRLVTITLADGRKVGTYTDGSGRVRLDTLDFGGLAPGSYSLTLAFAGDNVLDPAASRYAGTTSAAIAVTVTQEKATVDFQSEPQSAGTIGLRSKVTQEEDGSAGDLTKATLNYTLTDPAAATITATAPVRADGSSSTTVAAPSSGLYSVSVTVNGYFTGGLAPGSVHELPVYDQRAVAAAGFAPRSGGGRGFFAFATKYLRPPTVSAVPGPSSLRAGTYRVAYSFVTPLGESAIGMSSAVTVTGPDQQILVAPINVAPEFVTAINFYFTDVPAGGVRGFVARQPVVDDSTGSFTITSQGDGVAVSTRPTGAFFMTITNALGLPVATFLAKGTRMDQGFDWLVVTGNPSSRGVFEGTGVLNRTTTARYRVIVTKTATGDRFEGRIWDPTKPPQAGGSFDAPLFLVSGPVTPLPLEDEPAKSGIVFR